MYQHTDINGQPLDLPAGKVVCVGLNYAKHIAEMQHILASTNPAEEPILFIKPATSLRSLTSPIVLPEGLGAIHHEIELAVLIKKQLTNATTAQVSSAIWGYAVALDLTLRDLQTELKKQGRPWEKSKAFDNSCPISGFIPRQELTNPQDVALKLSVNAQVRQNGNSQNMLVKIQPLIAYMSKFFTLLPGDIVLTGTPEGVGALVSGDNLLIQFANQRIEQVCL